MHKHFWDLCQEIPCSIHKHFWDLCMEASKVRKVGMNREVRREKCWDKPHRQPYRSELMTRLSPRRGWIRLWLALHSAGGTMLFSGRPCRSGEYQLRLSPETWARTQHNGATAAAGRPTLQKEKQSLPITSQSSPPFALGVRLWNTLPANPRTGATESLFFLEQMHSVTGPVVGVQRDTLECHWLPLPGVQNNKEAGCLLPPSRHEPLPHCQQHLAAGNSTGISWIWSPVTHHIPLRGWSPGTRVIWLHRQCPPSQGAQAIFHHPELVWKVRELQES